MVLLTAEAAATKSLLLYLGHQDEGCAALSAWDASSASLHPSQQLRRCLGWLHFGWSLTRSQSNRRRSKLLLLLQSNFVFVGETGDLSSSAVQKPWKHSGNGLYLVARRWLRLRFYMCSHGRTIKTVLFSVFICAPPFFCIRGADLHKK